MAYTITSQCISCVHVTSQQESRCQAACPTHAIQHDGQQYWINSSLCNNCVDLYGVPQCWAACPTNGGCLSFVSGVVAVASERVASSESSTDYWESWFATYNRLVSRLKSTHQSDYWQRWFDTYPNQLSKHVPLRNRPSLGAES